MNYIPLAAAVYSRSFRRKRLHAGLVLAIVTLALASPAESLALSCADVLALIQGGVSDELIDRTIAVASPPLSEADARCVRDYQRQGADPSVETPLAPVQTATQPITDDAPRAAKYSQSLDADAIVALLQDDVFAHFGLRDRFRTELERRTFAATSDYATLLAQLRAERSRTIAMPVAVIVSGDFSDYQLSSGTFDVDLGFPYYPQDASAARQIRGFMFPDLPIMTKELASASVLPGVPERRRALVLRVPQAQALELERGRSDLQVVIVFRVTGLIGLTYSPYFVDYLYPVPEALVGANQAVRTADTHVFLWNKATDTAVWEVGAP